MYNTSDFNDSLTNSSCHVYNVTINHGNVHTRAATGHGRLNSLLVALVNDDLLTNRHLTHIDGVGDAYSNVFFFNFQTNMQLHAGRYTGHWGAITDANMDDNGTLWHSTAVYGLNRDATDLD